MKGRNKSSSNVLVEQLSTLLSPGEHLGEVGLLTVGTEEEPEYFLQLFHLNWESNGLTAEHLDALQVGISKSECSLHSRLRCSVGCRAAHGQRKGHAEPRAFD